MTPSTPVDSPTERATVRGVRIGVRQLPALAALTVLLAGGASALGATSACIPTASSARDAEDGLAIPQRPTAGLTKVVLRLPVPSGVGGWHRPLLARPASHATRLARSAEPGNPTPLYALLRVYRL